MTVIRNELDSGLPEAYSTEIYEQVCQALFEHIYESYYGEGQSKYVV